MLQLKLTCGTALKERMKVNKTQILEALKADLKAADTLKSTQDSLIAEWKAEYNGEPYGNERKGKSAVVSRHKKAV